MNIDGNGDNLLIIRGATPDDVDFSVQSSPIYRPIGHEESIEYINGQLYTVSIDTSTSDAILTVSISKGDPGVTFESLNPEVATVDRITGQVTSVSSGFAMLLAHSKFLTRKLPILIGQVSTVTNLVYQGYTSSLAQWADSERQRRIQGKVPPNRTMSLPWTTAHTQPFSPYQDVFLTKTWGDGSNCVVEFNPDCILADADLSPVVVMSTIFSTEIAREQPTRYVGGGVLITPQHIISAEHFKRFWKGCQCLFVDHSGNIYKRTVSEIVSFDGYDLRISKFSEPLPDNIKVARIARNLKSYVPAATLPVYNLEFHKQIRIGYAIIHENVCSLRSSSNYIDPPDPWYWSLIGGDSGSPLFFFDKQGHMVLVSLVSPCPNFGYSLYWNAISEAVSTMGGGSSYTLTEADMSDFIPFDS